MPRLLLVSGSTRDRSTNTAALRTAALAAPDGVEVVLWPGLADVPAFVPDTDGGPALDEHLAEGRDGLEARPPRERLRGVAGPQGVERERADLTRAVGGPVDRVVVQHDEVAVEVEDRGGVQAAGALECFLALSETVGQ